MVTKVDGYAGKTKRRINMKFKDLTDAVAGKVNCTKADARDVVRAFLEVVEERLAAGEKVALPGLGTFKVAEKAERTYRNPKTGESIVKPMTQVVKFRPSPGLKDAVA
jgi:DNA-binding protein HU-beta